MQLLVGQPLPADLPPPLPLGVEQIPVDVPPGLPSDLLERRPDIRAAERQLLAANANIGAAKAAFFPRITLTANLGTASGDLSGLFKSGSFAFTGTAQLLQPIFDAGRNQANLDAARVNYNIAVAQYERSIQSSFREVADALAGRATLGEQLRAQAAQTNALAITYRLADLRYRAGAAELPRGARCPALALRVAAVAGADAGAAAAEHGGPVPRPRRRLARSVRDPGGVEPGDSAAALTRRARCRDPAQRRRRAQPGPILAALGRLCGPRGGVAVEIASGTGQHAAHFAAALPQLAAGSRATPSRRAGVDRRALRRHRQRAAGATARRAGRDWPGVPAAVDAIFCANMLHISPWPTCAALMQGAKRHLAPSGLLVLYGPYLVDGEPTAPSNLAFEPTCARATRHWGLRRLADVSRRPEAAGLRLRERRAMPANNLLLVLRVSERGSERSRED